MIAVYVALWAYPPRALKSNCRLNFACKCLTLYFLAETPDASTALPAVATSSEVDVDLITTTDASSCVVEMTSIPNEHTPNNAVDKEAPSNQAVGIVSALSKTKSCASNYSQSHVCLRCHLITHALFSIH